MAKFCFNHKYFVFIFMFFVKFIFSQNIIEINIPEDIDLVENKIRENMSEEIIVKNLTCNFDLKFKEKEFLYLLGFSSGDKINYKKLVSAVNALIKKNKFEKIVISIAQDLAVNKSAHKNFANIDFKLTGCWIFSKVKVSGVWVGKNDYSRYYTIEPGDIFNIESHNHAINKLKNLLKTQGYFNSNVSSKINYDKETKLVFVDIFLERKSRFEICNVDFFVDSANNKKIEKLDKLKDKINKLFKDKFSKKQYSKILLERETGELKKYLASKGFLQVDIELIESIAYEKNKVDLKFVLKLHSKKEFVFSGNNFFTNKKLLEKILIYGRSAWLVPASILSGEILKEYHDKGFWHAHIDAKEDDKGYSFFIKEGDRVSVVQVEFLGLNSLDSNFLIGKCFSQFINSKFFDQELLDRSIDDLTDAYLALGFWDIKVLKHDFEKIEFKLVQGSVLKKELTNIFTGKIFKKDKTPDPKNFYKLIVSLDEGEKSYLKSIVIKKSVKKSDNKVSENNASENKFCKKTFSQNNKALSSKDEDAIFSCLQEDNFFESFESILKSGPFKNFNSKHDIGLNSLTFENNKVAFDVGILSEQKNWLLKYFKDKGNLYVEVNLNVERDGQNVYVTWEIDPGKLVTFGKTIILSGKAVEMDYVMRELQYKEGDIWDNNKLKASVARLRSLGIFDSVHLYPYKAGEKEDQKDLLLKLDPTDPYEIRTRVGLERYGISKSSIFGQGFTYKLGGAFLFKNPLKKADQCMVDFDVALNYRNASLSYIVPWVFNHQVKTTFKVYANRYEQPGFMCSKTNLYQAKQDGFLVGFNKIYNKVDFSLNNGLEWLETSVKTGKEQLAHKVARAINFDSCLLGKKIPYLWVEPVLLINTVDDKINPKSGYFTLISLKGMLPIERKYIDSFFVKFMAEQSFFKAITPKITGALRLRCGHIFHKCFKDITPIERFYLGGAHSIRSYEKDMCPPWGIFCDNTKSFSDSSRLSSSKVFVDQDENLTELDSVPAQSLPTKASQKNSDNLDNCVVRTEPKFSIKEGKLEFLKSRVKKYLGEDKNYTGVTKSGDCYNQWVVAPQGGRSTVSANIEARFDIYKSMSGVIFQDMGTLFDDKFSSSNFSQATGVGLRFNTAVGPIRFDIGWKWKVRNEFESRCAWFLAFGNAF